MTPAELVHAIRTAPCDDAALEVAEDYARHIVSVADASQAAAVAIARQSRAAEISAGLRKLERHLDEHVSSEEAAGVDRAIEAIDSGEV